MTIPSANSLQSQEFFTQENFKEINGESYNPRDVRTYTMPPLASIPSRDIYIHLAVPPVSGGSNVAVNTNKGSFFGNAFEKTSRDCLNLIIHPPLAKEVKTKKGLVKIETMQMKTLYPSWMISRYGHENLTDKLILTHPVDIYLDKGTKSFVVMFDEAFLDKVSTSVILNNVNKDVVKVYTGKEKGKKYLALHSKEYSDLLTLKDIGKPTLEHNEISKAFVDIAQNYLVLSLDSSKLEKVLILNYLCKDSEFNPYGAFGKIKEMAFNTELKFSYRVGAKYNDVIYPFLKDGTLDTTSILSYRRPHTEKGRLSKAIHDKDGRHVVTRIMPYTEEDYSLLVSIKQKLDEIESAIGNLFKSDLSDSKKELDGSLSTSVDKHLNGFLSLPGPTGQK